MRIIPKTDKIILSPDTEFERLYIASLSLYGARREYEVNDGIGKVKELHIQLKEEAK